MNAKLKKSGRKNEETLLTRWTHVGESYQLPYPYEEIAGNEIEDRIFEVLFPSLLRGFGCRLLRK